MLTYSPTGVDTVERTLSFDRELSFGGLELSLAVADDSITRQLGLSGTQELSWGQGLLFIFQESDRHGFWMKDMNYPIDIVWIDSEGFVVSVSEAVSPDTFPQVFYPDAPAQFVLEVPAGFTRSACALPCDSLRVNIPTEWVSVE